MIDTDLREAAETSDTTARELCGKLFAAAHNGDPAEIRALIEAGGDVNYRDGLGLTPLHWAASSSRTTPVTIRVIVEAGAELEARCNDGDTPLHYAALCGDNPAAITSLIEQGADPDARHSARRTALHCAAGRRGGDGGDITTALIEAGADLTVTDNDGRTALHVAGCFPVPDVITALTLAGADPDARDRFGRTPLHYAAYWGHADSITALIGAGADVHARDDAGRTPLHWAGETPLYIVTDLGDNPAAITRPGDEKVHIPAPWDPGGREGDNPAAITALIEAGADPNASNNAGHTPLDLARAARDFSPNGRIVKAMEATGMVGALEAENAGLRAQIAALESMPH